MPANSRTRERHRRRSRATLCRPRHRRPATGPGPARRRAITVDEPGQDLDRVARRLAIAERYENHAIPAAWVAVLRAMLPDENAAAVFRQQRIAIRKCQPQ